MEDAALVDRGGFLGGFGRHCECGGDRSGRGGGHCKAEKEWVPNTKPRRMVKTMERSSHLERSSLCPSKSSKSLISAWVDIPKKETRACQSTRFKK